MLFKDNFLASANLALTIIDVCKNNTSRVQSSVSQPTQNEKLVTNLVERNSILTEEIQKQTKTMENIIVFLNDFIDNALAIKNEMKNHECVICFSPSTHAITKCGHLCLCYECGVQLVRCPICTISYNHKTDLIRIFIV